MQKTESNSTSTSEEKSTKSFGINLKYFAALTMTVAAVLLGIALFADKITTIETEMSMPDIVNAFQPDALQMPRVNFEKVKVIRYQGFRSATSIYTGTTAEKWITKSKDVYGGGDNMKTRGTFWFILCVMSFIFAIIGIIGTLLNDNTKTLASLSFISSFLLSIASLIMMGYTCPKGWKMKYGTSLIIAMVDAFILFASGVLLCFSN